MLRFAQEKLAAVLPALRELLPAQWEETGDAALPCEPNWPFYASMEHSGNGLLITARDADNDLVGYSTAILHLHLNSLGIMVGTVATYYVVPGPNRALWLRSLIAETCDMLIQRGAKQINLKTEYRHSAGRLFERMGFEPVEIGYKMSLVASSEQANNA